jgi:hypothetical protein
VTRQGRKEVETYLWRTRLERLHGPSEELKLALGELRSRAIGDSGVIVVRHCQGKCIGWVLVLRCWCLRWREEDVREDVGGKLCVGNVSATTPGQNSEGEKCSVWPRDHAKFGPHFEFQDQIS